MGRFRRGKSTQPPTAPQVAWKAREAGYRRLGRALATVVVTLEGPPGAQPGTDTRLSVRNGSATVTAEPVLIAREAPGTRHELHRLWFTVELSSVMFGDGESSLIVDGGELPLPQPVALAAWVGDGDDEQAPSAPALGEAELRAAVAELEERWRSAQELNEDSRRISQVVRATLADVQREREQLLDEMARATGSPR
jgi:hypothetical protein